MRGRSETVLHQTARRFFRRPMTSQPITLVWFRRDLRLSDNTALQTAVRRGLPVAGVFVHEPPENAALARNLRRTAFIAESAAALQAAAASQNLPLYVLHGQAGTEVPKLAHALNAAAVVCAESYEPQGRERQNQIWRTLAGSGRTLVLAEDAAVLPKAAVMQHTGRPYTDFAPYKAAWLQTYAQRFALPPPAANLNTLAGLQTRLPEAVRRNPPQSAPAPAYPTLMFAGGEAAAQAQLGHFLARLGRYRLECAFPAKNGTARLSPYTAHGMLPPRRLIELALQTGGGDAAAWLDGLIRREFFLQLLYHYPRAASESLRPEYRDLPWPNNPAWFDRWKYGQTGYPLIDAAMRHLADTGWLHPRLRLLAAEFLTKVLLVDPRWGEAWFAEQLVDFDLAANNGGWQFAAGTGGGAPLHFQPANPVLQSQNLDPDGRFIRRHVPELAHLGKDLIHAPWLAKESVRTNGYPPPLAGHAAQRAQAEALFAQAEQAV